jgi:L-cysteine S-thiosulfotransferase
MRGVRAAALLGLALAAPPARAGEGLLPFAIVGDAIPAPLTAGPGDPARGRAIVADRTRGLCLLCHAGPFPEERFQGNLAPDLAGVGGRLSPGQLRLRLVDGRTLNPDTIMPSYYSLAGLARVGRAWQGRPILSAAEIEDVVAFLATLREAGPGESR